MAAKKKSASKNAPKKTKAAASKKAAPKKAKAAAKKKAAPKKKAAAKKAAPAKKSAEKKKKSAKSPATTPAAKVSKPSAPPPRKTSKSGSVSSMDVNHGHVFSLRPRVNTSFRPNDFMTAKRALRDEQYASLAEAARAVAEEALSLTRGTSERIDRNPVR